MSTQKRRINFIPIVFIVLLILGILFMVALASWSPPSPSSHTSGHFFEELYRYDLPDLEKPQNTSTQWENRDYYNCELSKSDGEEYVEYVFEKFLTEKYTLAYLYGDATLYEDEHARVKISENIDDFKTEVNSKTIYKFCYSNDNNKAYIDYSEGVAFDGGMLKIEISDNQDDKWRFDLMILNCRARVA